MTRTDKRNLRTGLLFISPWIVGFTVLQLFPIVMSLRYSLSDFSVLQPPQFIGLANYQQLFADDVFRQSLGNTFYYASLSIPLGILLALSLAMLLNTGVKGMPIYRTIFFLPSMVPAVALAMLWMVILNGRFGILNFGLKQLPIGLMAQATVCCFPLLLGRIATLFGAPDAASKRRSWLTGLTLGVAGLIALTLMGHWQALGSFKLDPPAWLDHKDFVKPALVLTSLWGVGQSVVIYLAGLQDVPVHLYEAAELDGADWWQKTWNVTLPMVSPVILFNGIMAIIGTFNYFAVPFIMAPAGKPARAAYFLAVNLYDNAFQYLRMGYAAAMAWILFLVVLTLTILARKLSEKHVHYGDN